MKAKAGIDEAYRDAKLAMKGDTGSTAVQAEVRPP